jgi:hypothetical protein
MYGISLGLLGPLGGSPAAVTIGAYIATPAPFVDIHLGIAASGPFLGTQAELLPRRCD